MNRYYYNRLILNKLSRLVKDNPNLRFNQLLMACRLLEVEEVLIDGERCPVIKDSFYEESKITWDRIK